MTADHGPRNFTVRQLGRPDESELAALANLLIDASEGGASVGFMLPLTIERAMAFWHRVAADVEAGHRILFVVEDASGIIGTVQLVLAQQENQPHRAEISKMLVHRRARRRGIGETLMRAAEDAARNIGRTVLVLDTATPEADRLYSRCGWTLVGEIPDYALLPAGGLCATRYYFKRL